MMTTSGEIEIAKSHPFSKGNFGFQISPLLQETAVYIGQKSTYKEGCEELKKTMGVEFNPAQLYRLCDCYGKAIEKQVNERNIAPLNKEENLYVMADGSMLLTRDGEPPWKETKLGRIFKSSDCLKMDEKPSIIRHSQYVAHLGGHTEFIEKIDSLIESFGRLKDRLVFVTDGAVWLRNWIADSYPEAISILDFYHVKEHLYEYAHQVFKKEEPKVKEWVDEQAELLLKSDLPKVKENIRRVAPTPDTAKKILTYYEENTNRMDYARYLSMDLGIIGSGAIESANRTVIQKRMKLSGQRWSIRGAQHMLNLRTVEMSHHWGKIIALAKTYHEKLAA